MIPERENRTLRNQLVVRLKFVLLNKKLPKLQIHTNPQIIYDTHLKIVLLNKKLSQRVIHTADYM